LGILRTFLALCVVVEHSGGTFLGFRPLPGLLAVQAFYVISGFYMALVLSEKYNRAGGLRQFYKARAHRLYPVYWSVLAATIVLDLILQLAGGANRLDAWTAKDAPDGFVMFLAAVANVVMFGLDWFRLTMDNVHENAGGLIIVVQAWTLGLELTFYVLVPVLIRLRSHWLVLIVLTSFAARAIVYHQGPVIHVWTNGFFPFELALFVAGMLAYRVLAACRRKAKWDDRLRRAGAPALAAILAFGYLAFEGSPPIETGWGPPRNWILLAAVALALPALFVRFGNEKYDDAIGQFSYPLYMFHFLVVAVVTVIVPKPQFNVVYVVMPLGLLGAFWLIRVFDSPSPGRRAKAAPARPAILRIGAGSEPSVLVTEHEDGFRVRLSTRRLTAKGATLAEAYDELLRKVGRN
jgi:peptidoglycan/LPS O-acetylase OafA/YrhL